MNVKEYLKTVKDIELTEESKKSLDEILGVEEIGEWIPKCNSRYYFLDEFGYVGNCIFTGHEIDLKINFGNYYKTEELAEKESKKKFAIARIKKEIKRLNDGWVPNWEDEEQAKMEICFNYRVKEFHKIPRSVNQVLADEMYLKSREFCDKLIKSHEKDLKLMLGIEV